MAKKISLLLFAMIFLIPLTFALGTIPQNNLYVEVNTTYPLVLLPLDNNVWNIKLYTNGSSYNFTWTGTQYELSLLFNAIGDYPFIINSTNTTGSISGNFLVRKAFTTTIRLYQDKPILNPFASTKYVNDFGFVTAELTNYGTQFNAYNPTLEKYISPLGNIPEQYKKPVFYGQYKNGEAKVKLYDKTEYAFRFIDGEITFPYSYSVPNVSKSYGTNIYLGKVSVNGTNQQFSFYLSKSDLNPYGHLLNWVYITLVIFALVISISLFFIMPDRASMVIWLGLGFIIMITLLRIGVWFLMYFK